MKPQNKSYEETEKYLLALQDCLGYLEDTSTDYLTSLEYIFLTEWKRVKILLKRKKK